METCHVNFVKPGVVVQALDLNSLAALVERGIAQAACDEFAALSAFRKERAQEAATILAERKAKSLTLAMEHVQLNTLKELVKNQQQVSRVAPNVLAHLDAAEQAYLNRSAQNDALLNEAKRVQAARQEAGKNLIALRTSFGWQVYIEKRGIAVKKAAEKAAVAAALAANICPDVDTPLGAAVLAELAAEPIMEPEVEVVAEKVMTKTQARKANKSKAPATTETVEDVVFDHTPARRQKRQSAAAVAEIIGAEGLDARMVARITKRQQRAEA